jgi:magnesium-transporting ATPase (P-type)
VTDADTRRWLLPDTQMVLIRSFPANGSLKAVTAKQAETYRAAIPKGGWKDWEVPFDTDRKRLSTVHQTPKGVMLYCKGALEMVLPLSRYKQEAA